jgi:hypothetical protein
MHLVLQSSFTMTFPLYLSFPPEPTMLYIYLKGLHHDIHPGINSVGKGLFFHSISSVSSSPVEEHRICVALKQRESPASPAYNSLLQASVGWKSQTVLLRGTRCKKLNNFHINNRLCLLCNESVFSHFWKMDRIDCKWWALENICFVEPTVRERLSRGKLR